MLDDLRRIHRGQIARLRELSVELTELSPAESTEATKRFAHMFVGAERAHDFLSAVLTARSGLREIEYGKWLWSGEPLPPHRPRLGWLGDWHPGKTCVRFDRRPVFPALRITIPSLLDEWAFSWPGVYAAFESGRAVVVSLDREVTCYDVLAPGKSPYR